MVVYFKTNLLYEKRNLSPKNCFQTYECFSQLYTEVKARKVNTILENFTGHKIESSVHVTLAKMKSARHKHEKSMMREVWGAYEY